MVMVGAVLSTVKVPLVAAGDVRSFEAIAVKAGQRQIAGDGFSTVFLRDNMIDFKREPAKILVKLAIFAIVPRTLPDELGEVSLHEF